MPTTTVTPRNPETPDDQTFVVTTTDERGNVSRQWIDLHELIVAVARMGDVLGYDAAEAGIHFTCTEAETVAAVLRAGGRSDDADAWIDGHAADDAEGDDHYTDDQAR